MKIIYLCLLNMLMMSAGQILFKMGVNDKDLSSFWNIIKVMFSPIVFSALLLYGLTTMLWLYILNKANISYAYPIQALAYPTVLLMSVYFFGETISPTQWIGVIIICFGVSLIVK